MTINLERVYRRDISRVLYDPNLGINLDFAKHLHDETLITPWEYSFISANYKKRLKLMTQRQLDKRREINKKIVAIFRRPDLETLLNSGLQFR